VPKTWAATPTKKKDGTIYTNPENVHERVRAMDGNPASSNPAQQEPYVKYQKDEKSYDKEGNAVKGTDPASHIPAQEFKYPPGQ
jgi:hypothetical protein